VISGDLTLGMMMAITYILGQMNAPIEQLLQFMRQAQDAKLSIPHNKTTAIVGSSGSGKTTMMKLLLKFFEVDAGNISIGGQDLKFICPDAWRTECGVVMQDGYMFNDSIAMGNQKVDFDRVIHAARTANIHEEIEKMPQGYQTRIGLVDQK
jgi:ATP-binding cassette subfamily B protein